MSLYLEIGLLTATYMSCWFILTQIVKDNGIVDIGWGLGFVTIASYIFFIKETAEAYFPLFLVTLFWGMRLAVYIFTRRLHEKKEDWRYQKWREGWGNTMLFTHFSKCL